MLTAGKVDHQRESQILLHRLDFLVFGFFPSGLFEMEGLRGKIRAREHWKEYPGVLI